MKKQLVLGFGLAVLATPAAFASKARLLALGESTNGSFFISDNRNVFLNAAEVNNNKDLVTFEWGSTGNVESDTAPNAEGGAFRSANNMVYGLYLGRTTSFNSVTSKYATSAVAVQAASNPIDLFIGGDAGVKWGVDLTYAQAKNDQFTVGTGTAKADSKNLDLNVGVIAGDLSVYGKAGLVGKAENKNAASGTAVNSELKRKNEYELGASYKITDYTVFAQYNNTKYDNTINTNSRDYKASTYQVGVARSEKLNDKTMAFVKLSGNMSKVEGFAVDGTTVSNGNETKTTTVPVSIGLEHDAASWLTLRGSVAQNLWSKVDDDAAKKKTVANSTNVNAGATLKFGELSIDGVVGTGTNGTVVNTTSENGAFTLDNLMTRVSMTYRF